MLWRRWLSQAPGEAVASVRVLRGEGAASWGSGFADEPPTRSGGANAGVENQSTGGAKKARSQLDWAELLRRTFAIEILRCVRCGGKRRVLAHVKGAGVTAILEHLGLPSRPPRLAPARGPPEPARLH